MVSSAYGVVIGAETGSTIGSIQRKILSIQFRVRIVGLQTVNLEHKYEHHGTYHLVKSSVQSEY